MSNQPLDGEFGLDYQLFVLRAMLKELPGKLSNLMLGQVDEVEKSIIARQKLLSDLIKPHLEDLVVDIKMLEFDRHATANERDHLQEKLNRMLGEDAS